ncbi:putative NADPH-dependent methylglyoxal reductase GRP2 [Spathaspora sp. JA1]|nr:putative NADPH-dependent methylglyoxal reductase GRP2 [Spathaspora sp. JA1]
MTKVFISGASGFIAQHIIKLLLARNYEIIGTVRTKAKGELLKSCLAPGDKFTYEIVTDISHPGAFNDALAKHTGITYVFHAASPCFFETSDPENDILIPAIKGTENMLQAIAKYQPDVKRVVLTSSDAAIYSNEDELNPKLSFNESNWNNTKYKDALNDGVTAYYCAKALAEKYAWEFMLKNIPNFGLVVINPVYVFGPQAYAVPENLNASNELFTKLLSLGPNEKFDNEMGGFIDVRDIAKAHVFAIDSKEAVGRRLLVSNGQYSAQMILDIINKHYPQLQLPKGNEGMGQYDSMKLAHVDNSSTRKLVNWNFNSLENIVVDTIDQLLANRKSSRARL